MNATPVSVAVIADKTVTKAEVLRTTTTGAPVKIKAVANGKYLLAEQQNGVAPENITVKRSGKNLLVMLEGTDSDQPQLIIEGFFDKPGELVGIAEDGEYHPFIATDGESDHEAAVLADGESSALALGAETMGDSLYNLEPAAGFAWSPALLALGGLAAIIAATGLGYMVAKEQFKDSGSDKSRSGSGNEGSEGGTDKPAQKPVMSAAIDNIGSVTGPIPAGGSTDDSRPEFTGRATPGNTIEIWDGSTKLGETKVNDDGSWSFTPEKALTTGKHSIYPIERDADGNKSEAGEAIDFTLDLTAPAKGSISQMIDNVGSKRGSIAPGESTDDTTPTLVGKAEPGSIVEIWLDGKRIGTADVTASGDWSYTPAALGNGSHSFTVVVTDPAGNRSLPSEPYQIHVDTVAPENQGIGYIKDNEGAVTGPIGEDGRTSDARPSIGGEGQEKGDIVKVIVDDEVIGSVVVGDDGKWEFRPEKPIGEGEHLIEIVITDPAGNESGKVDPIEVIVDTQTPENNGIGYVEDRSGDDPKRIEDGGWLKDTQPAFGGEGLKDGQIVEIIINDEVVGSVVVKDGKWEFIPDTPLGDDKYIVETIVKDSNGRESAKSDPVEINLDTEAPVQPAIGGIEDNTGDETGPIGAGGTTDDTRPVISGSGAEADTIIRIFDNDKEIGSVVVAKDGTWSFQPTEDNALTSGEHVITVVSEDRAGNQSEASESWTIIVQTDLTQPQPTESTFDTVWDDVAMAIGNQLPGSLMNDNQPTFGGTGVPGSVVYLYDGNALLATFSVLEDGSWEYTPAAALDDGDHIFRVAFGDETQPQTARIPEAGWDVEIDSIAPLPPVRPDPASDAMAMPFSADELLNNILPTLFSEAEALPGTALTSTLLQLADIDQPAAEQPIEGVQAQPSANDEQARLLASISPDDQPIY
ncbi:Ig-like domain-containing protein [Duffyella gerundensis]|uniref:Ig-like domain-containing protein n=1 Tax=Duffyella TaxID=3026546 RepID=UPI003F6E0483